MPQQAGLLPAPPSPGRSAAVAAGLYAAVGILWIVASDWVLFQLSPGPEAFATLQTWKGTLFVLVTAGFLFILLRFQFARRARATGELKAANERLTSHVENTPLALIEFDQEFRVSRWSKRAEDIFGWSEADVLGKRWSDWGFVPPEDLPEVERIINESLEAGESGSFSVNRNLRRDGQIIWCEWYNSWLRGADGKPTSMMSLAHDVTDELEATREVRRLNRDLEARVHRRTEELAQANADLRALSYSISHDLRAPVRAILGFGEIIRRRHAEDLPEEGRRYIGNILTAGEQMDRLIDGLLEYGKLDSEKVSREIVDPRLVIDEVVEELRVARELDPEGVEVVGAIPLVTADLQGVRRVVQNLLGNAWKYRAPDRDWRVRISGAVEGARVVLRVSDNGPGIAEGHRERVFELFERLHSQEDVAGAGLGLAVVKRLMELMGGTVAIGDDDPKESATLEGATFVLTFRTAESEHEPLEMVEVER
ncbi:MAG: PAS domain S-box protein [Gemmatimonadales bacterium]|nr:MAG: PAS domain S-box protein [Gemmatimonadales bacterium]